MSEVQFRSDVTVELVDSMGDEQSIVRAARVSTLGAEAEAGEASGLVRFLMREGHGTPFESPVLTFRFEVPVFVSRQIVKHRLCLSGDSRVHRVFKDGKSYGNTNNRIDKLWELWHVGAKRRHRSGKEFRALLPNRKNVWVRSYDEESLTEVVSRVLDVVKNGERETWEMRTASGKSIRATLDHKFFTPGGWRTLGDIRVGDFTYREGKVAIAEEPPIPPRLRQGIALWTSRQRKSLIPPAGAECYICGEYFRFDQLELDHIVPVVEDIESALMVDNLKPACVKCHAVKSGKESTINERKGSRQSLVPDEVIFIGNPQKEETYDLVLEGPWHNFVANGLATHNSSINEESGRYKELEPVFYIPSRDRMTKQVGKTGSYQFMKDGVTNRLARLGIRAVSSFAWGWYSRMREGSVAKEVARMALPVNIYSTMYMTANLRSWLNFIQLRTQRYGSHAQEEIAFVGEAVRDILLDKFPVVMDQFEKGQKIV